MTLHADLLEQANHLASREPRRPKQASLRRAVSTAYYALFHLILTDAVVVLGPNLPSARRAQMQRWFNHGEMKRVCQSFLASPFTKPLSLQGFQPSADLQKVARNFIRLQEERHSADYDLSISWTRWRSRQQVGLAREAFQAWAAIRGSEEANLFILSLLLWKNFQDER